MKIIEVIFEKERAALAALDRLAFYGAECHPHGAAHAVQVRARRTAALLKQLRETFPDMEFSERDE